MQRSEQRLALLQDKHAAAAAEMEQLRRAHDDERGRMLSETKRLEAELNLLRGGSSKPASQRIVSEEETTQLSEAG